MEIKDANDIIAEFMGIDSREGFMIIISKSSKCRQNPNGEIGVKIAYNNSWDWLMPVVLRIKMHSLSKFNNTDRLGDLFRSLLLVDIASTYSHCVEYIMTT